MNDETRRQAREIAEEILQHHLMRWDLEAELEELLGVELDGFTSSVDDTCAALGDAGDQIPIDVLDAFIDGLRVSS